MLLSGKKEQTEREAISNIRHHMAALGWPVDQFTDEQIKEASRAYAVAAGRFGVSAKHFGETMRKFFKPLEKA